MTAALSNEGRNAGQLVTIIVG